MKKILLILFTIVFVFTFTSCSTSTKEDKLINQTKKFVKTEFVKSLDNPKSYESISYEISDTVLVGDVSFIYEIIKNYKERLSFNEKYIKDDINTIKLFKDKIDFYQHQIDSISTSKNANDIKYIKIIHKFRQTNKMNAIVINNVEITYNPIKNKFKFK